MNHIKHKFREYWTRIAHTSRFAILLLLFLSSTLLYLSSIQFSSMTVRNVIDPPMKETMDEGPLTPKSAGYWSFQSIHIDNENGFGNGTWDDVDDLDWCKGSGTFDDPYILENITIDAQGYGSGITINKSADVYFIIRNCSVTNTGNETYDAGINIIDSNNGTLIDNHCELCEIGFYFDFCINFTVVNNTALNNGLTGTGSINDGFSFFLCDDFYVEGNYAKNNGYGSSGNGFNIEECMDFSLNNNLAIENNQSGFCVQSNSENNNITENLSQKNGVYGILIDDNSNFNNLFNNEIVNNSNSGIHIAYFSQDNFIQRNIIRENGLYGIEIQSDFNNVSENQVIKNDGSGIIIQWGNYNEFFKNLIKNNANEEIRIEGTSEYNQFWLNVIYDDINGGNIISDEGTTTIVDNGTIGNLWGDYAGSDTDFDNIGNDAYSNTWFTDNFPIAKELFNGSRILIDDNEWYDWDFVSYMPWCEGNGTKTQPYIINSVNVNGQGLGNGIDVQNSKRYVEIINSTVVNTGRTFYDYGIVLNNTINCKLNNLTLSNNTFAIYLYESHNSTISKIHTINATVGIELEDSNNNTLRNCRIFNSSLIGIYLYRSEGNIIESNLLNMSGDYGIFLHFGSDFNHLWANNITNTGESGVYVDGSDNNHVIKNNVWLQESYAINLTNSNNCRVTGNYVDKLIKKEFSTTGNFIMGNVYNGTIGKQFRISNESGNAFTWEEAVQDLDWCSGSGTSENPFLFENMHFLLNIDMSALRITNVNDHFIIKNCTFQNLDDKFDNGPAIDCQYVHNGTFDQNTIIQYYTYSIKFLNCSSMILSQNYIEELPMEITNSWNNTFVKNEIKDCIGTGLRLIRSENNTLHQNTLKDNNHGLRLDFDSRFNIIYNNTFDNKYQNAIDNGGQNYWNNSVIGNYWSNYTGVDNSPIDGIGDTPHYIQGTANAADFLPIWYHVDKEEDTEENDENDQGPSENEDTGIFIIITISIAAFGSIVGVGAFLYLKKAREITPE